MTFEQVSRYRANRGPGGRCPRWHPRNKPATIVAVYPNSRRLTSNPMTPHQFIAKWQKSQPVRA